MDTVSITALAGAAAVVGFIYTYVKDRFQQGRSMGQLEQRVAALENDKQILETLTQTLTETRIAVNRLEQKVDTWIETQR